MLAFPLDQKNSPHPTVYLTLDSPFNSCQQAMPNLGVFPVPEKGRSLLSPHNTQKEKCKTTRKDGESAALISLTNANECSKADSPAAKTIFKHCTHFMLRLGEQSRGNGPARFRVHN